MTPSLAANRLGSMRTPASSQEAPAQSIIQLRLNVCRERFQSRPLWDLLRHCLEQAKQSKYANVPLILLSNQLSVESETSLRGSLLGHLVAEILGGDLPAWNRSFNKTMSLLEPSSNSSVGLSRSVEQVLDAADSLREECSDWCTTTYHLAEALMHPEYCEESGLAMACAKAGVPLEKARDELRRMRTKGTVMCDMVKERFGTCQTLIEVSVDFTKEAERRRVLPMIGRVQQCVTVEQALLRSGNKRKVVLVGEAGSGRTQMVKTLAQRAVASGKESMDGYTPRVLSIQADQLGLDPSRSLRAAIQEAERCLDLGVDIILFIDNMETFWTRKDLAPILRKVLLESHLAVITATTPTIWRLVQNADATIANVVQAITFDRPNLDDHKAMARSYADHILLHQSLSMPFDVVNEAASLCRTFAPTHPEPATTAALLEAAAEELRLLSGKSNTARDNLDDLLHLYSNELEFASRNVNVGRPRHREEIDRLETLIQNTVEKRDTLRVDVVQRAITLKKQLVAAKRNEIRRQGYDPNLDPDDCDHDVEGFEVYAEVHQQMIQLQTEIAEMRRRGLSTFTITMDHLSRAAEKRFQTRIRPLTENEIDFATKLSDRVAGKIMDQDNAVNPIIEAVTLSELTQRRVEPMEAFLLAGPPGTGKTTTGRVIAQEAYGNDACFFQIDCTRFTDDKAPSELLGSSSPTTEGRLIRHIKDFPKCVIVFDEIDKGGLGIRHLLLRMTGDGILEEPGTGMPVFCRSALVLATTNLGQDRIFALEPGALVPPEVRKMVKEDCATALSPELMSRFSDVQVYRRLNKHSLIGIAFNVITNYKAYLESQIACDIMIQHDAGLQLMALASAITDKDKRADGREVARVILKTLKRSLALPLLKRQTLLSSARLVNFGWLGRDNYHDPNQAGAGHFRVSVVDEAGAELEYGA